MAPMRSTVPWPSFFQSRKTRPPNGNSPWQWTLSEGVSVPSCRPVAARPTPPGPAGLARPDPAAAALDAAHAAGGPRGAGPPAHAARAAPALLGRRVLGPAGAGGPGRGEAAGRGIGRGWAM